MTPNNGTVDNQTLGPDGTVWFQINFFTGAYLMPDGTVREIE